jgi:hypothetical protein
MSHLLTTFFWTTSSFSGAGQLDEGPFHVGTVTKFFKMQVRGQINYQGVAASGTVILANLPAFGVQQVAHGAAANDVITSGDSDTWLMRRQTGSDDQVLSWAPNTATGAIVLTNAVRDDWAGQLQVGGDTDLYLSIKSSNGAAVTNLNTFGTIRLWWE